MPRAYKKYSLLYRHTDAARSVRNAASHLLPLGHCTVDGPAAAERRVRVRAREFRGVRVSCVFPWWRGPTYWWLYDRPGRRSRAKNDSFATSRPPSRLLYGRAADAGSWIRESAGLPFSRKPKTTAFNRIRTCEIAASVRRDVLFTRIARARTRDERRPGCPSTLNERYLFFRSIGFERKTNERWMSPPYGDVISGRDGLSVMKT